MASKLNVTLGLDVSAFQKGLAQATAKLDAFSKRAQNMGSTLSQNVTLPLVGLGAAAVKSFADFSKLENSLAAVMGSSEGAKNEMIALRKVAENPGLAIPQVVQASARLQSVGISAAEARTVITEFGNAVARAGGNADTLDGVVLALTQISAAGKVTQEDLNQIKERLPEFGRVMKEEFGTTTAEGIRALGVSSEEFIQRATKALGGLERANGGLANSFDNFKDSVQGSLAQLGGVISEAFDLEGILTKLGEAVQNAANWFSELNPQVQRGMVYFAAFAAAIGPALFIVGKLAGAIPIIVQGFTALKSGVLAVGKALSFFATSAGATVLGVVALIAVVAGLYYKFDGVRRVINAVGTAIVDVVKLAGQSFASVIKGFQQLKEGEFKAAAVSFGDALKVFDPITLGKTFAQGLAKGFEDDTNYIEKALTSLKGSVQKAQQDIFGSTASTAINTVTGGGGGSGGGGGIGSAVATQQKFAIPEGLKEGQTLLQKYGTEVELLAQKNSSLGKSFEELGIKVNTSVSNGLTSFGERLQRLKAELTSFNEGLRNILDGVLNDAIVAFGNFLGDSVLGKKATGRLFLADLLGVIASGLEQLGKLAIAAGVAVEGIKKALQSLNPIAAIAGGAALIALSRIVKSKAASLTAFADGGIVYGPTPALVGEYPNARSNPEVIAPLSKLKDLIGNQGGGYIAETRISGNDLLILVSNAERRNGRIR